MYAIYRHYIGGTDEKEEMMKQRIIKEKEKAKEERERQTEKERGSKKVREREREIKK